MKHQIREFVAALYRQADELDKALLSDEFRRYIEAKILKSRGVITKTVDQLVDLFRKEKTGENS